MKPVTLFLPVLLMASCATPPDTAASKAFKRADTNGDGSVKRQEATNMIISDAFAMYDGNGDGFVDEAEFKASGGTSENFRKINGSGSGKITLEEAQASSLVFNTFVVSFDEADVNQDGSVTYAEYLSYIERLEAVVR